MLFSLAQTLVCVLLIQGGIYALHLTSMGSSAPASDQNSQNSEVNSMLNVLAAASQQHNTQQQQQQHTGGGSDSSGDALKSPGSLTPDFLQLERERLMMLGLAKQKAASTTGHRGRSYITGRVHMTRTAADEAAASMYPGVVMQQGRGGSMYGSKVTHPIKVQTVGNYDSAGYPVVPRRRPIKYDYGHEVTPEEIDLDAYVELEPEPEPDVDVDELLPDLDGYQYLDELLAEQQQRSKAGWDAEQPEWSTYDGDGYHGHGHVAGARYPHTFQTLEELEANPPSALQELFDIEQQDEIIKHHQQQLQQHQQQQRQQQQLEQYIAAQQQQQQQQQHPANDIRIQQKWQRKRAQQKQEQQQNQQTQQQQQQQQKPLQRNIFGVHPKQKQQQQHYYNQHPSKLSIANSEATATKHIGKSPSMSSMPSPASAASKAAMQSSSSLLRSGAASAAASTNNGLNNQASSSSLPSATYANSAAGPSSSAAAGGAKTGTSTSSSSGNATKKLSKQQQLEKEQLLHPNHKRSGSVMATAAGSGVYGGIQSQFGHSMASQLMLRSARGQRQYDVPQIECPTAIDGMERFACPTPDVQGRYRCIDDHVLCDGFIDCPEGEDENRNSCMFYKTTKAHLDVLADALLRWARG